MLGNEVSDYKKLKAVKAKISQDLEKKLILKSLFHCGSKVPVINGSAAVALVANKKQAKFIGVSSCKSSWGCPVCTARQMAKYGARIACALDALKEQNLAAAMITFTIPHTSGFSCEQATEILYNVWKAFTVHGNKPAGTYKNDIFANFCGSFNSKHRVRVTEYTWGKAGWHPHFHCLFWFPKNRINEILAWEDRLAERWLELCKRYTINQLLLGYPETQRKTVRAQVLQRVNIMYSKLNDVSKCVYISKKNNSVIVQESSQYITGWGADKEVTGNVSEKATAPDHYTWQQILNNAIEQDRNMKLNELQPAEGSSKKEVRVERGTGTDWWQLYFEYMLATRKYRHARVNFSVKSGLSQIIAAYKNTVGYKNILKKNATDQRKTFGVWKTVCWFTLSQWRSICEKDLEPVLLELATAENSKKLIDELLEYHQIPPSIKNEAAGERLEAILNAA